MNVCQVHKLLTNPSLFHVYLLLTLNIAFFGVKAAHHQASVMRGRNPKSLPKDSELWHYASVSGQRKNLIEHGRDMWAVIGELSLENSTSEDLQREDDHAFRRSAQGRRNRSKSPNSKPGTSSYSAGTASSSGKKAQIAKKEEENDKEGDDNSQSLTNISTAVNKPSTTNQTHQVVHLNDQVQKVLNQGTPLDIKVDFVTPSPVAYGMTTLLVNCADEVLYVDNQGGILELRLKPLSEVKPADRIKFKLLDLSNPTNPKLIKFGDPMWLVSLESDEDDSSLLEPTQPSPGKQDTASLLSGGHVIAGKLFAPPDLPSVQMTAGIHLESRLKEHQKEQQKLDRASSNLNNTTNSNTSAPYSNSAALGMPLARRRTSILTALTSMPSNFSLASTRTLQSDFDSNEANNAALPAVNHNEASICGFADVIRIAEQRTNDSSQAMSMEQMNNNGAAPLKSSMRYNSRQTMHLGKWMASDALRPDQHEQRRQLLLRQKDHSNPAHHQQQATENNNANNNSKLLMSLSPIIIQQDEYCLSTAQASEVKKWPPTSFDIVNAQQTTGNNGKGGHRSDMNARYLRHLEDMQMAHTLPPRLQSLLAKETLLSNKLNKTNAGSSNYSNSNGNQTANKNKNTNNANKNSANNNNDSHGKGCLRRIVSRSAPYDFGVDRRCVWKLCLFEEFSDNYMDLSSKEKHAKKVMEMASLGLKMSKKNREGGMVHLPGNTDENLPELRGGEHFARTLREITFKTSQRAEESFLRDRRIREYKLPEYFEERIPEVLLKEERNSVRPGTGMSVSSNSFRSLYSRELPTPKNEAWNDVGFSTDIIDRLSRKESIANIWRNDSQADEDKDNEETENGNTSSGLHAGSGLLVDTRRCNKADDEINSDIDEEDENNLNATSFHSSLSSLGSPSPNKRFFGKAISTSGNGKSSPKQKQTDNASQRSMTRTQSTLNAPAVKNMQRLNTIAELPIFNLPRRTVPLRTPKLSEDINRVFQSQLRCKIPTKEMLLLNTPDTLRGFKNLSTGEQVMALHRTMNYFNEVADHQGQKAATPAGVSRRKEHKIGPGVLAKIERLQQEDKLIVSVSTVCSHCFFAFIYCVMMCRL